MVNICDYGCGKEAKHQMSNGKWCCSKFYAQCDAIRIKNSKGQTNVKPPRLLKIYEDRLCDYGCGEKAQYQFLNRKYCCSNHTNLCLKKRQNFTTHLKNFVYIENKKILCDYGCGKEASYKLTNNKYCCSKYLTQCPTIREKNSNGNIGNTIRKGSIPWNKNFKNFLSEESLKSMRIKKTLSIKQIQERYPIFAKIEEMRYKPGREKEKVIQVHCKNHNCENSKEKDGWFTPTKGQISERIRSIEKEYGNDGGYFYCSENCKEECPLYGKLVSELIKEDQIRAGIIKDPWYNSSEYQIWRQQVFKLDNNKCVYCEKQATIAHHVLPQKTHPALSLDPDNGLSCCEDCHYKYGHRDRECTTGYLSQLICEKIIKIKDKVK